MHLAAATFSQVFITVVLASSRALAWLFEIAARPFRNASMMVLFEPIATFTELQ